MKKAFYFITAQYLGNQKVTFKTIYTFEGEFDFNVFDNHIGKLAKEQVRKYLNTFALDQHITYIPNLVYQS